MRQLPPSVAEFLQGKRFIVAGVSRTPGQPANAIFRKLRACGYEVIPVNPNAATVEGETCYPDLLAVPGDIDGLVIVTPPGVALDVVRQALGRGIRRIWFHRSFGTGSVSTAAVQECLGHGVQPIVGGCPLMYCQPVDLAHRCFRWWLRLRQRVPG
jgi:predicted CoA-binding protein